MCIDMPISTLKGSGNSATNIIMYILSTIGVITVIYLATSVFTNIDVLKKRSAITVDVYNGTADVYINDAPLGKTPFSSKEITPGENKIKIKSDAREYLTQIEFIANDKKYVHTVGIFADLGTSDIFSSAQEFWFEKDKSGNVVKVVSEPSGASVYIDNTEVGKTPYASDKLSEGEYDLRLDYPGYETQTARINIKKGYTLNIRFKLFPIPTPVSIKMLEGATSFYNLAIDNTTATSDTQAWVKAFVYWNKTRGVNIEGTGLNKEQAFDYFIDYKGNIFDKDGNLIISKEEMAKFKDSKKGGYLGRVSDGTGVTNEAKDAVLSLTQQIIGTKKATVLETGTGWLRVRDVAGLAGQEIGRVTVEQVYSVLEQTAGWVKLKVSDTITGWVSADYVKLSE